MKQILTFLTLLISLSAFAQDTPPAGTKQATTAQKFISKTGDTVRLFDRIAATGIPAAYYENATYKQLRDSLSKIAQPWTSSPTPFNGYRSHAISGIEYLFRSTISSNTSEPSLAVGGPAWTSLSYDGFPPFFDVGTTYNTDDYIRATISSVQYVYKSKVDGNTGHQPVAETSDSFWEYVGLSGGFFPDSAPYDDNEVVLDPVSNNLFQSNVADNSYAIDGLITGSWQLIGIKPDDVKLDSILTADYYDKTVSDAKYASTVYEWNLLNENTTITARDGSALVQGGDYLFLIGGWNQFLSPTTNSEVYRFSKYLSTTTKLVDAPWEGRHTFGSAQNGSNIYVYGGDYARGHYQPNAWKGEVQADSTLVWTEINNNLPWGDRVLFGTATLNNNVYIIGGQDSTFTPGNGFSDVWRSSDWGVTWTQIATGLTQFNKNLSGTTTSYNGYIYVISGGEYASVGPATYSQEVWRSADGITWEQMPDVPFVGRQYPATTTFDGRIFVNGGSRPSATLDPSGNLDDTWAMDINGNWTEVKYINKPGRRHAQAMLEYNGKLIVSTGNLLEANDTWSLSKADNIVTIDKAETTYLKKLRINTVGTTFTDFDSQIAGINGNLWLYGNNSPRTVDFVLERPDGFDPMNSYGGMNFYGKTDADGFERNAFIQVFVGDNKTPTVNTGSIKLAVRTPSDIIDTALVIRDDANVYVKKRLNIGTNIFTDTQMGYLQFGLDVANASYVAGGVDVLYLGVNNAPKVTVLANGNTGFGKTDPSETVDIVGKAKVSVAPTDPTGVVRLQDLSAYAHLDSISSGTYTPTITNTLNITSSTPIVCHYTRNGNEVTVQGQAQVTNGSGGGTEFQVTLPIASNLAVPEDLTGHGASYIATDAVFCDGDPTTDRARVRYTGTSTGSGVVKFSFTYTVIP